MLGKLTQSTNWSAGAETLGANGRPATSHQVISGGISSVLQVKSNDLRAGSPPRPTTGVHDRPATTDAAPSPGAAGARQLPATPGAPPPTPPTPPRVQRIHD